MHSSPKLDNTQEATNSHAIQTASTAPSLLPKPGSTLSAKGHKYLQRFHGASSSCYITRLPMNLIRTLVVYNNLVDLISLALTCKQFSRILRDKYVVGTYGDVYTDLLDVIRMQELEGIKVKIYETVRLRIVHINPVTQSFYALDTHSILEGVFVRYNDSLQVLNSRPCISDVSAVDVAEEVIVCANTNQLALSQPAHKLRIVPLDSQPTVALRIIGKKTFIVVLRLNTIEIFSCSLMALHSIQLSCELTLLYVPNAEKSFFATVDKRNTVSSYTIRGLQCVQLYSGQPLGSSPIKFIWMLREVCADFLVVWFADGELIANDVALGKFLYVRLQEKTLICLCPNFETYSNDVEIFGIDAQTKRFQKQQTIRLRNMPAWPSIVILWKHKAVLMGINYIVWATLQEDVLYSASKNDIKGCTPESVQEYGNYLLVKGKFCGKTRVEVEWCAVTNFAGNAMIERAHLEEEAERVVAEKGLV